jgi:large-conductance mechanosensitive channel
MKIKQFIRSNGDIVDLLLAVVCLLAVTFTVTALCNSLLFSLLVHALVVGVIGGIIGLLALVSWASEKLRDWAWKDEEVS